jgi:hypothetical protein
MMHILNQNLCKISYTAIPFQKTPIYGENRSEDRLTLYLKSGFLGYKK